MFLAAFSISSPYNVCLVSHQVTWQWPYLPSQLRLRSTGSLDEKSRSCNGSHAGWEVISRDSWSGEVPPPPREQIHGTSWDPPGEEIIDFYQVPADW